MGTNKENKLARFQKFQVLMAAGLNKALKNVGSVAGLLPYNEDLEVDKLMQFDIGAKDSPFGNIYGKALNPFTTSEVLQFVTDGLLTENDRMLFINQDTNQLAFWNGQAIVSIGSGGGGNGMDYLFGTGEDGDVTIVANTSLAKLMQYNNLTINTGVTLTSDVGKPIFILCKNKVLINGDISTVGKNTDVEYGIGFLSTNTTDGGTFNQNTGQGGGGAGGICEGINNNFNAGANGSRGGRAANQAEQEGIGSIPRFRISEILQALLSFNFDRIPNGGGNAPTLRGASSIFIIAKEIELNGRILAHGQNGANGGSGSAAAVLARGGSSGAVVAIITSAFSGNGEINVNGGAGGTGGAWNGSMGAYWRGMGGGGGAAGAKVILKI